MISQLTGVLISKTSTELIIDCHGVGYALSVSVNTSSAMPDKGNIVTVYIVLSLKEDTIQLFGFKDTEERETFRMLISIPGIGPKIALGILSAVTVQELQRYLLTGNLHAMQKLPGIGKKTADRINLELKDKIVKIDVTMAHPAGDSLTYIRQEAVAALVKLGYTQQLAEKAVKTVFEESGDKNILAEDLIRKALKYAIK